MSDRIIILDWENISLVVPEKQDIEIWYKWLNNPEIQAYLWFLFWSIISRENEEKYYENLNKDKEQLTFSIFINKEKKVIWNISLMKIDYRNMHTELWIAITDNQNLSKWYWTEAISLILKYVFNVLWLNKVYLRLTSKNERAKRVYEKNWFIEIWRFKKHNYIFWEFYDEIIMEIFKEDFKM